MLTRFQGVFADLQLLLVCTVIYRLPSRLTSSPDCQGARSHLQRREAGSRTDLAVSQLGSSGGDVTRGRGRQIRQPDGSPHRPQHPNQHQTPRTYALLSPRMNAVIAQSRRARMARVAEAVKVEGSRQVALRGRRAIKQFVSFFVVVLRPAQARARSRPSTEG